MMDRQNQNYDVLRVLSVVSYYGCETWTYSKAIDRSVDHKINAFEMWCYRRMLRIIGLLKPQTLMYYRKLV